MDYTEAEGWNQSMSHLKHGSMTGSAMERIYLEFVFNYSFTFFIVYGVFFFLFGKLSSCFIVELIYDVFISLVLSGVVPPFFFTLMLLDNISAFCFDIYVCVFVKEFVFSQGEICFHRVHYFCLQDIDVFTYNINTFLNANVLL